ncbi:MAG: phosphoglycerate dehydrogenase [Ignavibacterium sp.]|nr:MAG: phosphoglycerate dehydrogenase [Ignavibacterium sp.]
MKVKILIADKFPEKYVEEFKSMDLDVNYSPKLGENDLPGAAKDADILIVRSTIVNAETIKSSNNLNLIIRAGAGVNNIDISTANQQGIYVANCPGKNSVAVAELAIGLMISLDRSIPDNVIDFRSGKWNKAKYSKAEGLKGKTLGIIGVGSIGKEVANRAISFGMNVYGKDISRIEGVAVKDFLEMDQLLPMCDIVSIHLPATPETKGLFDKKMFSYLKPNTLLINTSRQDVIDENAMLEAIEEKNIRVALDVFKDEPESKSGDVSSPLADSPNIYITHHIGASTAQAQNAVAEETVKIVKHYLHSGIIDHWVNRAKASDAKYQLVVKHFDKPGVLATILDVVRKGDINIEEIENVIFEGGIAASCTMKLMKPVTSDMLKQMNGNENVLSVSHVAL